MVAVSFTAPCTEFRYGDCWASAEGPTSRLPSSRPIAARYRCALCPPMNDTSHGLPHDVQDHPATSRIACWVPTLGVQVGWTHERGALRSPPTPKKGGAPMWRAQVRHRDYGVGVVVGVRVGVMVGVLVRGVVGVDVGVLLGDA